MNSLQATLQKTITIAKWFRNHNALLAELRIKQKHFYGKTIALSLPVPTRWQSNLNCVKSILDNCEALKSVILEPNVRTKLLRRSGQDKAGAEVFELIDSPQYWRDAEVIKSIIEPFVQVIIGMEENKP